MLHVLAYAPAAMFVCLGGWANVLFALQLSTEPSGRAFWLGVAVTSTLWTVVGLAVVTSQLRAGRCGRAAAAGALLLLALGYDALAAYGLTKAEHTIAAHATNAVEARRQALAERRATARAEYEAVSSAPSARVARAAEATAKDRRERLAAAVTTARAIERERLLSVLADLDAQLLALPAAPGDARTAVLPAELVAWLPVALVLLGGLLGPYAVERPATRQVTPAPAVAPPEPVQPHPAPTTCSSASEPVQLAPAPAAEPFLRLYQQPPVPLDGDGWLRMPQRSLASALGMSPSRLNRSLRDAADTGAIALDTSKGTAYRVAVR